MKGIDQRLAPGDNGVDHQLMAALGEPQLAGFEPIGDKQTELCCSESRFLHDGAYWAKRTRASDPDGDPA
jgi:hypothetical protein